MSIAPHSHIVTAAHPARPPHMNDSARLNGLATTPWGTDGDAMIVSSVYSCRMGTVGKSRRSSCECGSRVRMKSDFGSGTSFMDDTQVFRRLSPMPGKVVEVF